MPAAAPPETPAPPSSASSSRLRRLVELDETWSLRIHEACRGVPRPVLKALEISGDGRFWFPLPIALLVAARSSPLLTPLLLALLAGNFLDLLLVGLVKSLVRRPRPVYNKGMYLTFSADRWSFPSGHSSRVVFIAIFLHLAAESLREAIAASGGPDLWWRWVEVLSVYGFEAGELFLLVVFMWSAATSISRVLLGRHFAFDVIAGACLGVLEAIIVFIFYSWIR
ncbi:hypothetical protein Taro_046001 [Colocasia esculenta]|uniref:Phosphatidic acid phosphatase type 2/haloperoxidase domain-containing protein n=1 Tax=Colocasia esculenta TaxID=4460 RepID=A0A843WSN3_COLES|nr:hypothetical protein [Colocasia esculenta]